jgi:hypothetical protein
MFSVNEWINQINYYYVYKDSIGINMLFVTHEDRVYALGANYWGSLGLGHNRYVCEPQELPELQNKRITNIVSGFDYIVFQSVEYSLYICGYNNVGQLGNGNIEAIYMKPMKMQINLSHNDFICEVSCGLHHTLVLTHNREVYGWGLNSWSQVGSRDPTTHEFITTPEVVDFSGTDMISTIQCYEHTSFALTTNGQVYSWGQLYDDMNISKPKLIVNLLGIKSLCSGQEYSYFLSYENNIYYSDHYMDSNNSNDKGSPEMRPKLLQTFDKHNDIYLLSVGVLIECKCLCQINQKVYELKENELIETNYENFFRYFTNKLQITYKTCQLVNDCTNNQLIEFIMKTFDNIDCISHKLDIFKDGKVLI